MCQSNQLRCRYPSLLYTAEGKEMQERLWQETMEEFNFAGTSAIVSHLK